MTNIETSIALMYPSYKYIWVHSLIPNKQNIKYLKRTLTEMHKIYMKNITWLYHDRNSQCYEMLM